jgi:hypothetical protein
MNGVTALLSAKTNRAPKRTIVISSGKKPEFLAYSKKLPEFV